MKSDLVNLSAEITSCIRCPRLVEWREQVAIQKRAAFADQDYWGRPVPGFGDPNAQLVIVGLAPAAHGANRTGRMFTGDRSGEWLYAALHRAGFANQAISVSADDGLKLKNAYVLSVVRCAPPDNKPTNDERDNCVPYMRREIQLLGRRKVFVALGKFAFDALIKEYGLRPMPKFGHGVEVSLPDGRSLIGSFHPSQQNTFTGKLTVPMFDAVFARALEQLATVQTQ